MRITDHSLRLLLLFNYNEIKQSPGPATSVRKNTRKSGLPSGTGFHHKDEVGWRGEVGPEPGGQTGRLDSNKQQNSPAEGKERGGVPGLCQLSELENRTGAGKIPEGAAANLPREEETLLGQAAQEDCRHSTALREEAFGERLSFENEEREKAGATQ